MLVLPAKLTHREAATCLRMLQQVLNASQEAAIEADASVLAAFDSSALAVLLECRREALALGKTFAVRGLHPRLAGLAALYGVDGLLVPQTQAAPAKAVSPA